MSVEKYEKITLPTRQTIRVRVERDDVHYWGEENPVRETYVQVKVTELHHTWFLAFSNSQGEWMPEEITQSREALAALIHQLSTALEAFDG